MFTKTEEFIGESMKKQLIEAMAQAGTEEKQHTIDKGDYHQGYQQSQLLQMEDGQKRSHKHSYNAKSGVAIIFGAYMKKLLFMGVRNKFCSIMCYCRKHKPATSST